VTTDIVVKKFGAKKAKELQGNITITKYNYYYSKKLINHILIIVIVIKLHVLFLDEWIHYSQKKNLGLPLEQINHLIMTTKVPA
jgi:vancomycin permeability regulator SanA